MNTEIRDLTMDELDQVSGGEGCWDVPGGHVCRFNNTVTMTFGNTVIEVAPDGSLTTTTYVPK